VLLSKFLVRALLLLAAAATAPAGLRASELHIPAEAHEAIRLMYSGKSQQAVALAHKLEEDHPDHPLGYLIEANIQWWQIYCKWLERRYNTIDAWSQQRAAQPDDEVGLRLADKLIALSEASIAKSDSAEMELYAGLGYASRARLLGLRYQKLATARAGVEARKHLLRCLELDPTMVDANLGLGLYNYYADTLSSMARILRFFMGIPGGDKRLGLKQLQTDAAHGQLTNIEARFNMARSLRNYDFDYAHAAEAAGPLITQFPENPIFLLVDGDIEAKLGHNDVAAERYRDAAAAVGEDAACTAHIQGLAREALAAIGRK
jgi:hypothetical protein